MRRCKGPAGLCADVKMSPPLFWLIWASAVIVGESTRSSSGTDLLDSNLLLYEDAVYHLINSSLGLESAQSYCRGGLSILTTAGVRENEVAAHKLLSQSHLKGPIWFGMNQQPKPATHLDFSKQTFAETTLPGFSFKTKDGFARVNASFPSLSAISVCVRVQWDPGHENISTVFSYAAPVLTNEFQLRGQIDESRSRNGKRPVLLALLIQGHHHPYKAELPLDTHWHHVCVTWRAADGLWAIYVDGKIGDSRKDAVTSRNISANGIFILGQDQDTFGGTFTEPFVGNMTDLNVWHEALSLEQVKVLDACTPPTNKSLVFGWRDRRLTVHPSLTNMSATLKCAESVKASPRVKEECAVLSGWSEGQSQFNTEPCTNKHPFICRSSKEQYLKIKEVRQSFTSNPSPFMQQLIEHGMTADDVISDSVDGQSWSSVSLLLNVSQQVMVEQEKQLESRDMVSLMMLLSRAADLPSSDNQSRGDVQSLGQNFITLADSLLSQDNTSKWSSIKEVVKGPMVVIQTVDRMVSNLNSLLTADTDHVQIHSDNIKLQVQQKTLSDTSSSVSSAFCGLDVGSQDCISVPAKILKELHNSGFGKVTLLNTWYNSVSVKCLTEPEENVTVVPVVSDGSQRYLRTVLGSSVISSTVLVDGRPLSMAIHFTLQHRVQNTLMKPVCAFWDFGLPAGGGWSTKGCDVISSYDNATSCYCNHTTNFALLMQMYEVQRSSEEEKSLQILSLIGSGVSLCGLVFTFILFVAVGVPKSDRTTVHKNLIVALAVAQLLFIFSDWASGNQEACWLVTALLHLFFLSSFCWMLVEGLLLWSKVVSVNISEERRMKLYYLLGWGLPVVVVAVTLSATLDQYKAERYCWLNLKSNVIWAFIGPVLFILAVNAVVLFRVVLVTLASARRRAKMLTPSSESKLHALDLTWAATRPVLILLPVLGLTWLCGVLLHLSDVLAYLFITLNAFQGLYIFLVYAVYNSEVRSAIRRIQEKRKALSFTNCSQPVSFLPSQKSPSASWAHSLPTHSSSDNSTANSLVFKNERFRDNSAVSFSMKTPSRGQVVQLTAFKPSGC